MKGCKEDLVSVTYLAGKAQIDTLSPYSTESCVRVGYSTRKKRDKQRKLNPCVPNANYIPLARVGSRVGHY